MAKVLISIAWYPSNRNRASVLPAINYLHPWTNLQTAQTCHMLLALASDRGRDHPACQAKVLTYANWDATSIYESRAEFPPAACCGVNGWFTVLI